MNRLVNQILKTVLSELFVDALKDTVQLSMGSDLFSSSKIHLKDLTLRSDIFNSCLHPFKMISGHLGSLKIEGIAEVALGGIIKISIENVFILFTLIKCNDPEHIQILKKILLELISTSISYNIVKNMLRKLLGLTTDKNTDYSKQRKLIFAAMKHIFKIIQVTVKKIHIRIELNPLLVSSPSSSPSSSSSSSKFNQNSFCAIGITLPSLRIAQNLSLTCISDIPTTVGDEVDPQISLLLKALQVYCDYDCTPYCPVGDLTPAQQRAAILKRFSEGWSTEIHTALLLPFDMEVLCQIGVDVISGRLSPKLTVAIPHLRVAFDPLQFTVFKDIIEAITIIIKRTSNLLRVKGIFTELNPPPRVKNEGGIHILPQLLIGRNNLNFPGDISIPRDQCSGFVELIKSRCEADVEMGSWAKHVWRHAIQMVINDLRQHLPFGRWKNLILLCWARKEYSFLYGKYLRHQKIIRSKQKIPSPLASADIIRLFEYEMEYPISIILQFREVAVTAFYAQDLFQRKKNSANNRNGSSSSNTNNNNNNNMNRRNSNAIPPRTSIIGGLNTTTLSSSSTTATTTATINSSQDFQQAMSWKDVLHMITILKDEQKGIVSYVATNDDDVSTLNVSSSANNSQSDKKTVNTLPKIPESTVSSSSIPKNTNSQNTTTNLTKEASNTNSNNSTNISSPSTNINSSNTTTTSNNYNTTTTATTTNNTNSTTTPTKNEETKSQSTKNQENKKFSLGISLTKDGPPVELSVPVIKGLGFSNSSSSKTASNLLNSVKHGFEQLGMDTTSNSMEQSKGTPSKKSTIDTSISAKNNISTNTNTTTNTNTPVSPSSSSNTKLDTIDMENDTNSEGLTSVSVGSSRSSMVLGDMSRFNTFFARSLQLVQDGESLDHLSESDDEWGEHSIHSSEDLDFLSNNIHTKYAAMVDAARWVIRKHQSPISVLLPNAQLTINKIELSLRLPVENSTRRPIISVEVLNTSILLSASSTTGHSNNDNNDESDKTHSKAVLLAGFLIILKLSIQSLSINLHKRKIENLLGKTNNNNNNNNQIDNEVKPTEVDVLVPLLRSKIEEHFLNVCLLVDIPPGNSDGDKAAIDIQVGVSTLDLIFKKDVIGILVEPKVRAYISQMLYSLRRILIHLGVLLDQSLVLEHSIDCLGVPSVMLRNLHLNNQNIATQNMEEEQKEIYMKLHKQAVTDYLNTSRYYRILCTILPKGVLSLSVKLSTINADMLSSTSIKTFLIITMQDLFDRALSDPNSTQSLYTKNALNAYLKQASKKTVRKSTKLGQRMSMSMFSGKTGPKSSAVATIDPISIEMKKATDPIPLITLSCMGFNCSLPVDDDTICRGLALLLSTILPFYSIKITPPPKIHIDDDDEDDNENHEKIDQTNNNTNNTNNDNNNPDINNNNTNISNNNNNNNNNGVIDNSNNIQKLENQKVIEPSSYGLIIESKLALSKCPLNTWRICDFSSFDVRVDNGIFKKEKRPSGRPFYNPICVYGFKVNHQIEHIASIMPTPIEIQNIEEIKSKGIFIPPILVTQIHIPIQNPHNVMQQLKRDGPGISLVIYFTLSKSAIKELDDMSLASPSLKLFNEYCKHSYKDHSWQSRMKMITSLIPNENSELPPLLIPFNKKPILLRDTGVVYKGSNYLEIDVNVQNLNLVAGLGHVGPHILYSKLNEISTQIGFVVEGRSDNELPETLCSCIGLNKIVEEELVNFNDA